MDWFQAFSPMQVHWEQKWIAIPYKGDWSVLQGLDSVQPSSLCLQLFPVEDKDQPVQSPVPLHPQIQHLMDSFCNII
jgi:hypothetical protein